MTDEQMGEFLKLLKDAQVRCHVRGTDQRPVVEFKTRGGRVVGGIEMKKRLKMRQREMARKAVLYD